MKIQSFINNKSISSNNISYKKNPFSGENMHEVVACDVMQAVQAIQTAQKAFSAWKLSTYEMRIQLLKKIINIIEKRKSVFTEMEANDQGLPFSFVEAHGIAACVDSCASAIIELSSIQDNSNKFYSAVGVISVIASWNLSLRVVFERVAPAIAAGNAVVVKVSSEAPSTAAILAEIITAAEVPEGLIQVIISSSSDVKDLLLTHPAIKAISFAGSLKNSVDVLKKSTLNSLNQFKKIQISAGSKNTAVCLSGAEMPQFEKVMSSFLIGQGQLAWNSNRLFVLEKYENDWTEKISNFLNQLSPAKDIYDKSIWGPCLRATSFQSFSEIERLAKADQAQLIQSTAELSTDQKKCFLKPTFTKDMSNCSTLQQDQVIAPLFILSVVKYPFDIAKYSNVSYYGQSAHVWGEENKIEKIAEQLEVALVCKNKWSVEIHEPNKGVKQSAYGLQDYRVFGEFYSNVKIMT